MRWQQNSGNTHTELLAYQFAVVMMSVENGAGKAFDSSPAEVNRRTPVYFRQLVSSFHREQVVA